MNVKRIEELLQSMPPEAPFYTNMGHHIPNTLTQSQLINRTAYATMDPKFAWIFAMAFVNMKRKLPYEVTEHYIRQAYDFERNGLPNSHIKQSLVLRHPRWTTKRYLLEALLIIPSLSLGQIADLISLHPETVKVYENLFFNVRDRLDDLLYINDIVYPETRQIEFRPNYFLNEDPGRLMLRAAHRHGLEAVLEIYGWKVNGAELSPEVYAKKIKTRVLAEACHIAQAGGINQADLPVMKEAFKLLVESEKNDGPKMDNTDSQLGLTAIGLDPGQSVLETAKGLNDDSQFKYLLKLQSDLNGGSVRN